MDDSLEQPNTLAQRPKDLHPEDDDQPSDDEDRGLDWTKLIPAAARPVIPKRGEKEFEPRTDGGTNLQIHILDRARSAMIQTLRATRSISSKGMSYGIWIPALARTHVTIARGIHFSTMGHSVPRQTFDENGLVKIHKRLELLPEEAIYLVERGALFCWKECDIDTSNLQGFEGIAGTPMSVQQVYTEMIGRENLTLEKFQVYAYLRRLGYAVMRTEPPNDSYPTPPPFELSKPTHILSMIRRIFTLFSHTIRKTLHALFTSFNWWKPFRMSGWAHHNYASVYSSLRFLPSGHTVPLQGTTQISHTLQTPYKAFYNVYKPSTAFKKSSPTRPDFQIVVVNARTTPMPTLYELSALFDLLPELPPPLPRPKLQAYGGKSGNTATAPVPPEHHQPTSILKPTFLQRTFPFLFPLISSAGGQRRPNPFAALKQGKKMIVIAAVDNGNISFFRFSQGAFEEWPMT